MSERSDVLSIDEDRLDYELQRQARLYGEWSKKLAEARYHMDRMKAKYDLVWAESALEIRNNPKHFGIERLTEGLIADNLTTMPGIVKAQRTLHKAKLQVDLCEGVVRGLDHKRSSIQSLVTLVVNNLHSTPAIRSEVRGNYEQAQKKKIREATKITKRRK